MTNKTKGILSLAGAYIIVFALISGLYGIEGFKRMSITTLLITCLILIGYGANKLDHDN